MFADASPKVRIFAANVCWEERRANKSQAVVNFIVTHSPCFVDNEIVTHVWTVDSHRNSNINLKTDLSIEAMLSANAMRSIVVPKENAGPRLVFSSFDVRVRSPSRLLHQNGCYVSLALIDVNI